MNQKLPQLLAIIIIIRLVYLSIHSRKLAQPILFWQLYFYLIARQMSEFSQSIEYIIVHIILFCIKRLTV